MRPLILAAGGDVGGSRALAPALSWLAGQGCSFAVLQSGFLAENLPQDVTARVAARPRNLVDVRALLASGRVGATIFSTSVADLGALRAARAAREAGVGAVCVMDSWMNARTRLATDGGPVLVPDRYALMNDLALKNALKDGLPPERLVVTGQPALADLALAADALTDQSRQALRERMGVPPDRTYVLFVSEPVENDQGADPARPDFRGYTEKTVLARACRALAALGAGCGPGAPRVPGGEATRPADRVWLGLLPHPREDAQALADFFETCRQGMAGSVIRPPSGRDAVLAADAVVGMASILLYESWLVGRPTLSVQPECRRPDLVFLRPGPVSRTVTDSRELESALADCLDHARNRARNRDQNRNPDQAALSELARHAKAPETVGRLTLTLAGESQGEDHS